MLVITSTLVLKSKQMAKYVYKTSKIMTLDDRESAAKKVTFRKVAMSEKQCPT